MRKKIGGSDMQSFYGSIILSNDSVIVIIPFPIGVKLSTFTVSNSQYRVRLLKGSTFQPKELVKHLSTSNEITISHLQHLTKFHLKIYKVIIHSV